VSQTVHFAATLCKTVEGGAEQFSATHNYVYAGGRRT
jgi:hypothetical protein